MKILKDIQSICQIQKPIALAAGFFDGIHRGHRKVLANALASAKQMDGQAWVLTFKEHPLKTLKPGKEPVLLTSAKYKLKIFEEMRFHGCILLDFSKELAATPAYAFASSLIQCVPPLREIITGTNWRFGYEAKGTPAMLSRMGRAKGLKIHTVSSAIKNGVPISSTRIRKEILDGNLSAANKMLGRPFSILGSVVHGMKIAARLGFPTANLAPAHKIMPPFGVYAAVAFVKGKMCLGVLSFGIRPTFDQLAKKEPVAEIHLFDFSENIYGKEIEIFFVEKIRDERKFDSVEELISQIKLDIKLARAILCKHWCSGQELNLHNLAATRPST